MFVHYIGHPYTHFAAGRREAQKSSHPMATSWASQNRSWKRSSARRQALNGEVCGSPAFPLFGLLEKTLMKLIKKTVDTQAGSTW